MKNWVATKERYLQETLPHRLGELASSLSHICSFSRNPQNSAAVLQLLTESQFFIEWLGADVSPEQSTALIPIQDHLTYWKLNWEMVWTDEPQRLAMANDAKAFSEQVLELSGLLSEATASR